MAKPIDLNELKAKHAALEEKLAAEAHRTAPDAGTIAQIKREKLRLKDKIASLTQA